MNVSKQNSYICGRLRISHALNIKYMVYFSAVVGVLAFVAQFYMRTFRIFRA